MSAKSHPASRASSIMPSKNPPAASITEASKLAFATPSFDIWADKVKLDPVIYPVYPDKQIFRELSQIVQSTNQLPRWMSDPDSINYSLLKHDCKDLISLLCDALQGIHPTSLPYDPTHSTRSGNRGVEDQSHNHPPQTSGPGDDSASGRNNSSPLILINDPDLDLARAMSAILGQVKHSRILFYNDVWTANEAELRTGVDNLLSHVYAQPGLMIFRLERELKLPKTKIRKIRAQATKPNALVFLEFGSLWSYVTAMPNLQSYYSCLPDKPFPKYPHVIHSLVEYKQDDSGKNQALMGLVSGLYQRRALGIDDQFVFATFQNTPTRVQVVAGIWMDQMIRVYELSSYSLLNPVHTTQFYLLHRAIKKLGLEYQDRISKIGERSFGFPTTRSDELGNWDVSASSSSASRTEILGRVCEGNEREPQESGPPGNKDFRNSLKRLGQADVDEKMRRFFESLGSQVFTNPQNEIS